MTVTKPADFLNEKKAGLNLNKTIDAMKNIQPHSLFVVYSLIPFPCIAYMAIHIPMHCIHGYSIPHALYIGLFTFNNRFAILNEISLP